MPIVTGYESDDEWNRKTNPMYGKECRNVGLLFGGVVGAIAGGVLAFANVLEVRRGMDRVVAPLVIGGCGVVGGLLGAGVGSLLDATVNPRAKRKDRGRVRRGRGKGKNRGYRLD